MEIVGQENADLVAGKKKKERKKVADEQKL